MEVRDRSSLRFIAERVSRIGRWIGLATAALTVTAAGLGLAWTAGPRLSSIDRSRIPR